MFINLYSQRLALCVGLTIAGFITVARAETEIVAAIGVALTSTSTGLGESTLVTYMIKFGRQIYNFSIIYTVGSQLNSKSKIQKQNCLCI